MSKFSPEEIKKLEQILNPKEEIEKIKKRDFNHIYRSQKEVDEYIKQVEESQNNEYYNFSNVLFLCKISFNYKFKKYALFSLACFIDSASFSNAIFTYEANFQNTTFYKNALFNETIFKNEVRFTRSSFAQTANFQAIEIKGKAYFDESVFNQELLLHDSILEDYTNFEGVEFKDKVKGWNITCLGNISFKWANFRNKVNFSELKVNNGSANFHGTNFEENAYFYNSKINTLILSKSVIDKGVYFLDANIKNANRETWCIIKHEFIKQDNRIEALSYHALEMAAYDLELGKLINCKGLECIYKFIQFIVCSSISFLSRIF